MNPILRNISAFFGALFVGGLVNMGIIMLSGSIIPPPAGVDHSDMESMNASMHLYKAKHFLFPFLAHALGTLVAAGLVAKLAASHQIKLAIGIGALFLLGGIAAVIMLPAAPTWFKALDLLVAYLPMGYLGGKLMFKGK
ncbi:MAG: hypothetical protein ACI94Y_004024 [Maribacter sp.]|jgi:hypothetical protein